MKLLLNIASRKRPGALQELLYNIKSTISGANPYSILVKIDDNDTWYNNTGFDKDIEILRIPAVSKVYATNYGIENREFDIIMNVSDDMRFVVKNWDIKMIYLIRTVWPEGTDFYPAFNDGFIKYKLATLDIQGYEYFKRTGYIYHDSYKSVSCDAENLYVAMMLGKHHYFSEVLFKHIHPANDKSIAVDRTYIHNDQYGEVDTKNYFKRMADNFYVKGDLKAAMEKLESYAD